MGGPETTQPATTPDQTGTTYAVTPEFEREMATWGQSELETFWRDTVRASIVNDTEVVPYSSPSGDRALEERVNEIIENYLDELLTNPASVLVDAYNVNRVSPATDSTGPHVAQGADPVNLFDGDFVYAATDFQIDGAGFDFVFTRTYSQLCTYRGPLGANWDHPYNLWLRVSGDATIIQRSDGALHEQTYRRHEHHDYWMPPDGGRGVILESGTSYVHRQPDGVRVLYQPHPTLHPTIHVVARIEDRFGNHLDFIYVEGRLGRVLVNHPERVLDFSYDGERLTAIRDFTGRTWRYYYDDLGDLVAVTTPPTVEHKRGLTTRYDYSTSLQGDPALQHLLTAVLDADGRIFLENEYGTSPGLVSYRRVTRQREGSGDVHFDYADVVESFDVPYSPRELPTHQTIVTERDGRQVRHLFNRFGQMLFREEYARLDGVPRLVSSHHRYNRDGNLTATMSPLGCITQFLYERDIYEKQFPPDEDYRSETDPNLTLSVRLGFDRLLAVVTRGRYYNLNTLNLAAGVWRRDVFPDVLDTDADDVIQKFTYEPEFGQVLTVSDPRVTKSADPTFVEGVDYLRRLTRCAYASGHGFQSLVLDSVTLPTPTLPDGTSSLPIATNFNEYDDRGRLLRIVASNGLEVRHTYAGASAGVRAGFLETTTLDPAGQAIRMGTERDLLGRAVKVFRPPFFDVGDDRHFISFEYDELSRVVRSVGTAPFAITTRNMYTRAGTLSRAETQLKDENNALTGSVVSTHRYDDEHKQVAQTIGDAAAQHIKRSRVVFDRAARPYLTIGPSGRKRKQQFNERSLVAKTIEDYGGVHAVTRAFYDADGRLIRVLDPRGHPLQLGYDALGRLVDTADALGNRVIRHFDKVGNLLVECRYEKAAFDRYRLLARREFVHDEIGRLIVVGINRFTEPPEIAAAGLHTAFRTSGPGELLTIQSFFDSIGNLVKQVDQGGRPFLSEYDLLGRATRKLDPDGNELRYRYDKEGNVVRIDRRELARDPITNAVTKEYHFAEEFVHDELGRLIEHRTTNGRLRYRFDSEGNQVELEDALGNRSRNRYDVFGRLVENVQLYRRQAGDVPVPVAIAFTYDADDRELSQTDALGRITRFDHDSAGRRIATVLPDGSSDAATYDRAGNLISYRDRNGLVREVDWDPLNRPIALRVDPTALVPDVAFVGATAYSARYDGLGRLSGVGNDFVNHRYAYNSLDHTLRETTSFTVAAGLDPSHELVVAREFSATGALSELTYPSGRALRYRYDTLDRVVAVDQVSRGADYPGDLSTPPLHAITTLNYVGSRLLRVDRLNGVSSTYAHDFAGRIVELRHVTGASPVLTLQLLHDGSGNPRHRIEVAPDFQGVESFRYDSLSRLFESRRSSSAVPLDLSSIAPLFAPAADPVPDLQPQIDVLLSPVAAPIASSYEHDLVGNRLASTRDGTPETYQPNALDQYTQVGATSLRYDRNGNLVEDSRFLFAYDVRNQLSRIVRKSDGQTIDLLRDYFGRSCIQREGSRVTTTVYDDANLIEHYEDGQLRRSVVYDNRSDTPFSVAAGGRDLFLLNDLSGSVRYVFDGPVRSDFFVYDEYGNIRQASTNGLDNPFRFAGKQLLDDTGRYDFLFRVYDPARGRFDQRDPAGYVDGSNLYNYARNSPLAFRDPDGRESRPEQNSGLDTGSAVAPPLARGGLSESYKRKAEEWQRFVDRSPDRLTRVLWGSLPWEPSGEPATDRVMQAIREVEGQARDLVMLMTPSVRGFTTRAGIPIHKSGGPPEPGDPFWTIHAITAVVPMMMEASLFEEGINYQVLARSEVAHRFSRARLIALEAELSIGYKPGFPTSHNKIGITVDGTTEWMELIPSEEFKEFSANRLIQLSQLTFGNRPAHIRFYPSIKPSYQITTMPITRSQAVSALAEARSIAANPGTYGIVRNSCTTFCRSVMSAAGKQPAWWGRTPGLLFKSVR